MNKLAASLILQRFSSHEEVTHLKLSSLPSAVNCAILKKIHNENTERYPEKIDINLKFKRTTYYLSYNKTISENYLINCNQKTDIRFLAKYRSIQLTKLTVEPPCPN